MPSHDQTPPLVAKKMCAEFNFLFLRNATFPAAIVRLPSLIAGPASDKTKKNAQKHLSERGPRCPATRIINPRVGTSLIDPSRSLFFNGVFRVRHFTQALQSQTPAGCQSEASLLRFIAFFLPFFHQVLPVHPPAGGHPVGAGAGVRGPGGVPRLRRVHAGPVQRGAEGGEGREEHRRQDRPALRLESDGGFTLIFDGLPRDVESFSYRVLMAVRSGESFCVRS